MATGTLCVLNVIVMCGGSSGSRYHGIMFLVVHSVIAKEVVMGKRTNEIMHRAKSKSKSKSKATHFSKRKKRARIRGEYRAKMMDTERKVQDARIMEMVKEIEQAQY
jgi:hypothetical protein